MPRIRRNAAMLALILLIGALTVGVATGSAEPDGSSATPVVTTVVERTLDGATPFTDNPAIVDGHAQTIDAWSRLPDDHSLVVYFTSGTPECYGVHAEVEETSDIVTVKLRSGVLPDAVDRACTMIALTGSLTVGLETPVGNRAVVSIT